MRIRAALETLASSSLFGAHNLHGACAPIDRL
jgi:hypothetical protein